MTALVHKSIPPLRLELGLDDVKRAGHNARSEPSYGTCQGVELGVRSRACPLLHGSQGPDLLHLDVGRSGGDDVGI